MKLPQYWTWPELRQRFVLTPEEKRVIAFVIAAFLLGAGTKCYRATHPRTPVKLEKKRAISQRGRDRADPVKHD